MATILPHLSVIIATKNRADELRTISLPSLAKQDTRDFEILVWDASSDSASRRVVEEFANANPDLMVRYFDAPRAGLPAQRNDAVREAEGRVIFFIDDDSEVSPDGISVLTDMFARDEALAGGCLPLDYQWPAKDQPPKAQTAWLRKMLLTAYSMVFIPSFRSSGVYPSFLPKGPGTIDYLTGCDMAVRKEVFREHLFDERLQKYGGYALLEDQLFSRQLLRAGAVLSVSNKGLVTHRAAAGSRGGSSFNKGRMDGYNAGIVWKASVLPYSRWSAIPFLWARIGFFGVVLMPCLVRPWQLTRWKRLAGYFAGLWVFALEGIGVLPVRFKRGRHPVPST